MEVRRIPITLKGVEIKVEDVERDFYTSGQLIGELVITIEPKRVRQDFTPLLIRFVDETNTEVEVTSDFISEDQINYDNIAVLDITITEELGETKAYITYV